MNFEKLEKLAEHRDRGTITEEEFLSQKERLLNNSSTLSDKKFGMSDDSFNILLHVSQYLCYALPLLGIIAPLFLWLRLKDEDPEVDKHGRAILNWNISVFLYVIIGILSMIVFVGIFLLIILGILTLIYPVLGALAAKDGRVFSYPPSIKFL